MVGSVGIERLMDVSLVSRNIQGLTPSVAAATAAQQRCAACTARFCQGRAR